VTTKRFYFQDSLGNTSHVTNEQGTVLERYTYSAFGKPSFYYPNDPAGNPHDSSAIGIRHLFQGQLWTKETGLNDYRNRVELPTMGVFLQPDPIGFKGDAANLYRFCNNNALNRTDPLGLMDGYIDSSGYHKYHMVPDTKPLSGTDGYHQEGVKGTENQQGDRVRFEVERTVTKADSLNGKGADTDRRKSVIMKDGYPTIKLELLVRLAKDAGYFTNRKVEDAKTGEWVISQGYLDAYGAMRERFAEQASLRGLSPDQTIGLINSGDPSGKGIFQTQSLNTYDLAVHHKMGLYWETAVSRSPNDVPYSRHTPLDDKGEPVTDVSK
jgi:RHS repeat-associated protein